MEESQAILRLKQGDWTGLETLVQNHQTPALHAAFLILQDRAAAEDVVQEAFLNAARKIAQFDAGRPFRPWFLRSVINAALKAAKQQSRLVSLNGDEPDERPGLAARLADPRAGPDESLEAAETRRAVRSALDLLTPKQRAAIVMRYYLEMPAEEMVHATGASLAAVKWSLHAARRRLHKLLGAFRDESIPLQSDERE